MLPHHDIGYPDSVLQPYIRCYLDVHMGVAGERVSRLLPAKLEQCLFVTTGHAPVVSRVDDTRHRQDMLSPSYLCNVRGAVSGSLLQLGMEGILSMFVIIFKPSGFYRLFGIPPVHFSDAFIPVAVSLGSHWETMGQQIANARGMCERQLIAEKFLLSQWQKNTGYEKNAIEEVLAAVDAGTSYDVVQMAKQSYLSERQFRRVFTERTGLPPQIYLRIARSRRALCQKQLHPQRSWRSIAFELGYTDQSHFNREMKILAGIDQAIEPAGKQFLYVEGTTLRLL
ncbi:MAG: helix-turn-helix transcriptional regulator [Chitinophagaceae bacterium]|nr:helix-turn-helix transcriptional regulator [Chitinophagaceae bacterium]